MIEIYKTVNNEIVLTDAFGDGVWVNLVNRMKMKSVKSAVRWQQNPTSTKAALDEEERQKLKVKTGELWC